MSDVWMPQVKQADDGSVAVEAPGNAELPPHAHVFNVVWAGPVLRALGVTVNTTVTREWMLSVSGVQFHAMKQHPWGTREDIVAHERGPIHD